MVLRRALFCVATGLGSCALGTLEVEPWAALPARGVCEGVGRDEGGFGVEGDDADVDFLVFATGMDGRGPVGGMDGLGRAVAAILQRQS